MIIRALCLGTDQWTPVAVRRECLWWHDGPVGYGAKIEIDWCGADLGHDLLDAQDLLARLQRMGYRNVRLSPTRVEVGT